MMTMSITPPQDVPCSGATSLSVRWRNLPRALRLAWAIAPLLLAPAAAAQVSYTASFRLTQPRFKLGEPVFCEFVIQNTGAKTFMFTYRVPTRALNRELEQEPRFTVTDAGGRRLPDPAPHPCGGAKGTIVYGSVTLPPGHTHTEIWLLNQWARFTRPGNYSVHAERRLPLVVVDPAAPEVSQKPSAYAVANDTLTFTLAASTAAERRQAMTPYAFALQNPDREDFAQAFVVATTLPQPDMLVRLKQLAEAPLSERRWDRRAALEALARLGTPAAWNAILAIAQGKTSPPAAKNAPKHVLDEAVRGDAVLLLGEKADPRFIPPLVALLNSASDELRGDILRALGFFRNPKANEVLFKYLHSTHSTDRVNAILGLRNLEMKEAVPALIAMLEDREPEVRQVADFALSSLAGQKVRASEAATPEESAKVSARWHAWWVENEATFQPHHAPACRDW